MLDNANFLCEIGTEEIPAGYIPPAIKGAQTFMRKSLEENRINYSNIAVYATPRRFIIMIEGLADFQKEQTVELKGPSKKGAYESDGQITKALQGFMKGNNVSESDLYIVETDKGSYVYAKKMLESKPVAEIIPSIITELLSAVPFPKRMRWSDKRISYPRPVSYFLILFNDKVVPFEIEGISSSNLTRGHYIQHNKMVAVEKISDYGNILKTHGVIPDQDERRSLIIKGVTGLAEKTGGRLVEDEELLDTVTFLVESPHPVLCDFSSDFLEIPDIVLIAEMKEHQKYFAITGNDGRLINKFIAVSNNPETEFIKSGNERVISARFNDADFFYKEDKKIKLIERVDDLKSVLFHKELGSIYDKVSRMREISAIISEFLKIESSVREKIDRAALLCKTDLVTAMVFEFSSLQGKIGRIYALEDGEDPDVAEAIDAHYRPGFHEDALPDSIVSIVLSIAEKIDNIFGSFSVGNIPKGSQDPYALRRQANAVVEMLIRNEINVSFEAILKKTASRYRDGDSFIPKIIEFFNARAKTIFAESGFSHDEIDAGLSTGSTDYLELYRRAGSLNEFRKDKDFSALLLSFKRMNNIVSAFRKKNPDYKLNFDESLFEHESEKQLYDLFNTKSSEIQKLIEESRYIDLFRLMITAREAIDRFFDNVLVMDKRTEYRDNRLYVLETILANFTKIIDFSKISD